MTRQPLLAIILACFALCGLGLGAQAQQRAGEVRALIPAGYILRGGAPQREAKKQDPILWQDVLRTDRAGRLRVALDDGSILNVGSESQLNIVKHDPREQRTELQLAYGRLRANVARIARPGGGFTVRTAVAVAGVVGTRFTVRISADFVEVLCLEDSVRVSNADPDVPGEVVLRAGQFTRVARGQPPAPAQDATPEQMRESEDDFNLPVETAALSRVEASWPPAACGQGTEMLVRAWTKQTVGGKETEIPVEPELISGRLTLGNEALIVEGGRASLRSAPSSKPPQGAFTIQGTATPVTAKIWEPVETEAGGEGWRAPRALFVASAFAVMGPMLGGRAQFSFGGQEAQLLWQGACGAGFLAPMTAGREYDTTLSLSGTPVARGKMNLISVSYRLPVPPTILRGQPANFGIDLQGLENLSTHTQGRPVLISTLVNVTPMILGNLRSSTPGAKASGETIVFTVAGSVPPGGVVRLDGTGTGRQKGMYQLNVDHALDAALRLPRTTMTAVASAQ